MLLNALCLLQVVNQRASHLVLATHDFFRIIANISAAVRRVFLAYLSNEEICCWSNVVLHATVTATDRN